MYDRTMMIGYTGGVFDLFHIGHVNLLRNARSLCDKLIVGVTTDELAQQKIRKAVIPFEERLEVIRACRYVDIVVPQKTFDKFKIYQEMKFDILFVGDDWLGTQSWKEYEKKFLELSVKVIFLPYTRGTTSTLINQTLERLRNDEAGFFGQTRSTAG